MYTTQPVYSNQVAPYYDPNQGAAPYYDPYGNPSGYGQTTGVAMQPAVMMQPTIVMTQPVMQPMVMTAMPLGPTAQVPTISFYHA